MKHRRRIYYSTEQRTEIWDRWKRGESAHEIGRLFDRGHSSIFKILMKTGGLRPPMRRRSRLALTLAEREEISRGLVAGLSIRSIAATLRRAVSTVSREIKRNGGARLYRAVKADKRAWAEALRPKPCKLVLDAKLRKAVIVKLERHWSPQQIAGWLKRAYPEREDMHISHETLYKSLYIQARGALKKELLLYLRSQRRVRRSRYADPSIHEDGFDPYSLIHGRVDIYDYPDGRFEVLYQGRLLPFRVYNKSPRVQQGDVVSNKRLSATLALIKAQQDAGETKSYKQRRRRTAQTGSPIAALPGQGGKTSLKKTVNS